MIYTITSTLPKFHAGRTKALLKRIDFIQDKLKRKQTILTTNYDPNYRDVYQSFEERELLKSTIPIINLYEWLSDYNVYNVPKTKFKKKKIYKPQPIRISNYTEKEDEKRNAIRYYDQDTGKYIMYRQFFPESDIIKFEDYFVDGVKHKIERHEFNMYGYLHRISNFSRKINKKTEDQFYDLDGNLYCRRFFDEDENNRINSILIYKHGRVEKGFSNEKDLFTYFFNHIFEDGDTVFDDARLLDKSLLNCDKKIKPIMVLHNAHVEGSEIKPSYKTALLNSDKVFKYIVLTNHQKEDIQSKVDIPDDKFAIIPHFIENQKRKARKKDRFIYMGRFAPEKQITHIIEAYKIFKEKGYPTKLVLFGAGIGAERKNIEKLVHNYHLENDVTIETFTEDPLKEFRESKASILTSRREGFGLTVMESINEGCPVISYDVKYGPREIIEDGENGYIVEVNNIQGVAESMVSIVEHPLENVKTKKTLTEKAAIKNFKQLFKEIDA
ncbi:glycosyl transferase family 1 [Staphylococcus carnosus]|uniref:glycosyltransferase n=1 Tax=Staphylococcus carnosus TaxID=1281 RepID=UPI0006ABE0A6|nr:glycosyltransferase [Staphylococcus carnosus]KOR13113.1 glycosyl transferase family 1 [Staphylococcus carnosus]